LQYAQVLTAS